MLDRVGMGVFDFITAMPARRMADAFKAIRSRINVRLQHGSDSLPQCQVCEADDTCSNAAVSILSRTAHRGDTLDKLCFANR